MTRLFAFIVSNPVGGVDEYEKELSVALRIVASRSEGKGSHLKVRGIARVIGSLVDADGLTAVAQAADATVHAMMPIARDPSLSAVVADRAGGEYFAATPFNEDNHLRPEPVGTL